MKRTTKILASTTGMLAVAAFAGLISGSATHSSAATVSKSARTSIVTKAGVKAINLDDAATQPATHDCKGKNSCKGQGGCQTGDQGCKGKNSCQGKGGCKTNGGI